jgi:hypothetical protein
MQFFKRSSIYFSGTDEWLAPRASTRCGTISLEQNRRFPAGGDAAEADDGVGDAGGDDVQTNSASPSLTMGSSVTGVKLSNVYGRTLGDAGDQIRSDRAVTRGLEEGRASRELSSCE